MTPRRYSPSLAARWLACVEPPSRLAHSARQLGFHQDPRQALALIVGRFGDHAPDRTPIIRTDSLPVLGSDLDVGSLS